MILIIRTIDGLNHNVILATHDNKALIKSIGIITGEISQHDWHEVGIHMFEGGHNTAEQFGIKT